MKSDDEPLDLPEPEASDAQPEIPPGHPSKGAEPPSEGAGSLAESSADRREFVRKAGQVVFYMTIIGSFGGAPLGAMDGHVGAVCKIQKDGESTSTDQPCSPPPTHHVDANCVASPPDEGCYIQSKKGDSSKDVDENCGTNGDQDQSCGDCDDNHETDENCGKKIGTTSTTDRDELCGHISFFGSAHEDQNCNKSMSDGTTAVDEGCGHHDTIYNDENDPDQNCGKMSGTSTDPDSNCSTSTSDATCGSKQPAYSSDPDEKCSGTDVDEGCGQGGTNGYNPAYDNDASCGSSGVSNNKDETCGASAGAYHNGDENCSTTDNDEGCKLWWWDPDAGT